MKKPQKSSAPKKTVRKIQPASSLKAQLKDGVEKFANEIENMFSSRPKDTISAVKMDHEALRNYLGLLKDTDRDMAERRRAYVLFSALLKSHTLAEEEVVYRTADALPGREMHLKVAEGYVEHKVAEDLMARIERADSPIEWSAHANVLAESVEHHLKEEERDLLPKIRKETPADVDMEMLVKYLALRGQSQTHVTKKSAGALGMLKK